MTWSRTLPVGVSKAEHYEGFSEIIEIGKQVIYDRTKRLTDLFKAKYITRSLFRKTKIAKENNLNYEVIY